ncbi:MAG: hypothetical protein EOS07_07700 [Mesorhizobium sp.]|nr:MAG: hypothetical protein EOQ33_07870 [Mesorhizobium sp.]RWO11020.1 MAG: hypothetical protein EOS07_07700 [Mesorhizobium sp.]RWO36543.1 MAG: hypothetical protein EOS08_00370 [Mesorhizobium sp.]RWP07936.1 MAG: hypothetical protein EOQ99_04300 [Mesorhizobium sp.]RWP38906.1 MAG: hypothetical protein EOR04_25355 [Mesorhizobium sp.]
MRGLDWTWDQQPGCDGGTERRTVRSLSCGQNVTPTYLCRNQSHCRHIPYLRSDW